MKVWPAITAFAVLAGAARAVAAQGPAPLRWPAPVSAPLTWHTAPLQTSLMSVPRPGGPIGARDSARIAPTRWKTGALIGGGFLGVLSALAFVGMCGYDSPCHGPVLYAVGGFAFGGLVGFGLGALIGGQFPAPAPPNPEVP